MTRHCSRCCFQPKTLAAIGNPLSLLHVLFPAIALVLLSYICVCLQAEQMTKQLQRLTPGQMSAMLSLIKYGQRAKQALITHKLLVLSVLALLFALFLRWLGFV